MAYTVLARKYRPQRFSDLVGQEHVTRTLGNAIESGRVAHAFLFTGARGVGKTSTARLLAKALNCEQGPTPSPCNECDPCRQITQGNDMDVLEIDGASNNSVDDVRRLQETLPFRPARDRFKVVIVDEVHMLSTGAFNAFLKTLEEPPEHVKFIFATTEVHKVPITIRSRCQRHDFRLIPQAIVVEHVRKILTQEGIEADDQAIYLVAREAAGSMRDALTVLDQVLAFSGETLTGEAVEKGLGIAGRQQVHAAAKAVLEGNPEACLRAVFSLGEAGLDLLHFSRQLLEFLRDLVVLKVVGADSDLVDLTPDERALASELAKSQESAELERAFSGVSTLVDSVAQSGNPRLTLEMGLVRLADRPRLQPLSELVAKLDAVLPQLGPGGAGPGAAPSSRGGGGSSRFSPPSSQTRRQTQTTETQKESSFQAPKRLTRPPDPLAESMPQARESAPPLPTREPDMTPATPPPPAQATAETSPIDVEADWRSIVVHLRDRLPALGAVMEHGVATQLSQAKLVVRFSEGSFFGRQAKAAASQKAILDAAEEVLGARPALEIEFGNVDGAVTLAKQESEEQKQLEEQTKKSALNHPAVRDAIEIFPEARGHAEVLINRDSQDAVSNMENRR